MLSRAIRLLVDNTSGSQVAAVFAAYGVDPDDMPAGELMRITAQRDEPEDDFERDLWHAQQADLSARRAEAEARDAEAERHRLEAVRLKACERLAYASVPECRFDDWQQPCGSDPLRIRDRVQGWVSCVQPQWASSVPVSTWQDRPLLVLSGPYGRGKTHLAVSALRYLAEAGHTFAYGTLEDFLGETDPSQNRDGCRAAMQHWQRADVVLLDEVPATKQAMSDRQSARFYELINSRMHPARPTVLTTNRTSMEPADGEGLLDAVEAETRGKLLSRVSGRGLFLRFGMEWPDYRQRGQTAREGV